MLFYLNCFISRFPPEYFGISHFLFCTGTLQNTFAGFIGSQKFSLEKKGRKNKQDEILEIWKSRNPEISHLFLELGQGRIDQVWVGQVRVGQGRKGVKSLDSQNPRFTGFHPSRKKEQTTASLGFCDFPRVKMIHLRMHSF